MDPRAGNPSVPEGDPDGRLFLAYINRTKKRRIRASRKAQLVRDEATGRWYHPGLHPVDAVDPTTGKPLKPRHGTGVGYREWCCQCPACTRAASGNPPAMVLPGLFLIRPSGPLGRGWALVETATILWMFIAVIGVQATVALDDRLSAVAGWLTHRAGDLAGWTVAVLSLALASIHPAVTDGRHHLRRRTRRWDPIPR